jgi:hypothetical protein
MARAAGLAGSGASAPVGVRALAAAATMAAAGVPAGGGGAALVGVRASSPAARMPAAVTAGRGAVAIGAAGDKAAGTRCPNAPDASGAASPGRLHAAPIRCANGTVAGRGERFGATARFGCGGAAGAVLTAR